MFSLCLSCLTSYVKINIYMLRKLLDIVYIYIHTCKVHHIHIHTHTNCSDIFVTLSMHLSAKFGVLISDVQLINLNVI